MKLKLSAIIFGTSVLLSSISFAQVKIGANPTVISTDAHLDVEANNGQHTVILNNGNLGVGTATPSEKVTILDGNLNVSTGTINTFNDTTSTSAAIGFTNTVNGRRNLIVGQGNTSSGANSLVTGFGNTSTTNNSFVFGYNNEATNINSMAGGANSSAQGQYSIALGLSTTSTGNSAVSFGYNNLASGNNSVAIGHSSKSSGGTSVAIGFQAVSSGSSSMALGHSATASGNSSFAVGFESLASGDNSVALGRQARANGQGSVVLSDAQGTNLVNNVDNRIVARFIGGYSFRTNTANSTGVQMSAGDVSWSSISDIRTKKDISALTDGLSLIMKLQPKKYHYKDTDEKHYSLGFIAQEVVDILPDIVNVPEDPSEYMSIRYTDLISVLTKAIQEQQAEIETLKTAHTNLANNTSKQIASLADQIKELKESIDDKKSIGTTLSAR